MDLFDFMFPEQAEASHLRKISREMQISRIANSGQRSEINRTSESLDDLRQDVKFLNMVVLAIIKRLGEGDTMNIADMSDILQQIDGMDGKVDGGLDTNVLRGLLGAVREAEHPTGEGNEPSGLPSIKVQRHRR